MKPSLSKPGFPKWRTRQWACRVVVGMMLSGAVLILTSLPSLAGVTVAANSDKCTDLGTLTPGEIRVAILSFMPIIGQEPDGTLTGLDGDNLKILADKLGCKINASVTDSAGALAAVQAHRVDATIGSWGWTPERAKVGLFTDPLYYQPVVIAQRKGATISRVAQLTGHSLCTLTGFVFIPAMHQVPQATVSTYPTIAAMLLDIEYSRCDVGFGNPLVIPYAEAHNPDLKDLSYEYLAQPTDDELKVAPLFGGVAQGFSDAIYLPLDAEKLENALSPLIDEMVVSGEEAKLLRKWGVKEPAVWLTPRGRLATERIGIDRPAGWQTPKCTGSACE